MPSTLSDAAKDVLRQPFVANLATVDPDGTPHITPVWIDVEGEDVLVNTARGRKKQRNLEANSKVALSVVDPQDPYRVVALQGIAQLTDEGADAHIDALAKKYLGADSYPFRKDGEERMIVRIRPRRVLMQP